MVTLVTIVTVVTQYILLDYSLQSMTMIHWFILISITCTEQRYHGYHLSKCSVVIG